MSSQDLISKAGPNDSKYFTAHHAQPYFKQSTYIIAIVLAIFPYTGFFGIHDFIIKRYQKGTIHITLIAIAAILVAFSKIIDTSSTMSVLLTSVASILVIGSAIWSLSEVFEIRELRKAQNTAYHIPEIEPEEVIKTNNYNKKYSIISIIATMIPIILWIICLVYSGGSTSENGKGAIFWLLIMYYWSIGIPLFIIFNLWRKRAKNQISQFSYH